MKIIEHIDTAIVTGSPSDTYGYMYSMHKYWSKKPPDVIAEYIKHYTDPEDIILDPFCGAGIVACEAIRFGRRAIAIDINPMATFITRVTLEPVNLSWLQENFDEVKNSAEEAVSQLFVTKCPYCGKDAEVEFVVRNGEVPIQIAYRCNCSDRRLFKDPDKRDRMLDRSLEGKKIPFWFPDKVVLPIIQKERFKFLHELFTRRNLIALSMILDSIERVRNEKIRDVLQLAFTSSLDKCSRLKPLSGLKNATPPSLSEGWVAVRFYAPRMWQEVNPWHAFSRSFDRVYKGKKESNEKLKYAVIGHNFDDLRKKKANVLIFNGSADSILRERIPENTVDYVLTDPPYGGKIQYLALSTFWGAWLDFDFDYNKELVINRQRGKTLEDYERYLEVILKSIRRTIKPNRYIHIFYADISGPYLNRVLRLMKESTFVPERVVHQPPPNSFGVAVRDAKVLSRKGHYGSYIIRSRAVSKSSREVCSVSESIIRDKVINAAKIALQLHKGHIPLGIALHSIYQKLNGEELSFFAQNNAKEQIKRYLGKSALFEGDQLKMAKSSREILKDGFVRKIRMGLLDSKSLFLTNPEDKKNQIFQRVLKRFQEEGVTIDVINAVSREIGEEEVKAHRKKRLQRVLHLLGKILNYDSSIKKENKVVWEIKGKVGILFEITETQILVKAYRGIYNINCLSEVGTIRDLDFENALDEWCKNNPDRGKDISKMINPMSEYKICAPKPKHLLMEVLENKELCMSHYLITLKIPHDVEMPPKPGQFFLIICDPDGDKTIENGNERGYSLTLRRPFSVHRINYLNFERQLLATPTIIPYEIKEVIRRPFSRMDILYKVVGEGTDNLRRIEKGRYLDIKGPLGNGFNLKNVETAIIVAGGIGVAPLVALAEKLRFFGSKIYLYLGAMRKDLLRPVLSRRDSVVEFGFADGSQAFLEVIKEEFIDIGVERVEVCTDDGSVGHRGFVADWLEKDLKLGVISRDKTTVFACGPSGMMKRVSDLCREYDLTCQVLLEERMACGIGTCLSCTCHIRGKDGEIERRRVCADGPVFDSKEIVWQ